MTDKRVKKLSGQNHDIGQSNKPLDTALKYRYTQLIAV